MKALRIDPGCAPVEIEIENDLHSLQEAVGGYIETFPVLSDCCLICDEEGLLKHRPSNFLFAGNVFVGTVLAVGVTGEEFCSLTDKQIETLKGWMPDG